MYAVRQVMTSHTEGLESIGIISKLIYLNHGVQGWMVVAPKNNGDIRICVESF